MAEGRSNGAICQTLFLSPKTVEAHIRQIFLKLGIRRDARLPPARGRGVGVPASVVSETALPSGTVTFLFTDIEGSTQLLKELGEDYGEVLIEHQRLLRGAFENAAGREVDAQGDAFFAVFGRAKDAVAAALEGQRALAAHSWPGGAQVRVRMGLHTGEPSVAGERYVGLGVHRAARICAAAHGGQLLASQATYAVLVDEVLPDIAFRDLGEHRLKDLDRSERLFQLAVPDLPSEFPPPRTLEAVRPGPVPFAGREGELAAFAATAVKTGEVRGRRRRRLCSVAGGACEGAGGRRVPGGGQGR